MFAIIVGVLHLNKHIFVTFHTKNDLIIIIIITHEQWR